MIVGALVGLVGMTGWQTVASADDNGSSEATVSIIKGKGGEIAFDDLTTNAHIEFKDTGITGSAQTATEKVDGKVKIKISDLRGLKTGEGAFQVTVADTTEAAVEKSFKKNGMQLSFAPVNENGTHKVNNLTVGETAQKVITGVAEDGVTDRSVIIKPSLLIPDTLKDERIYRATLTWTLDPDI